MMEIKGFITNLGKYNEGQLVGEWVTFPIDDDELAEVLILLNQVTMLFIPFLLLLV